MANLNIVILAGNLTRDPELRYTPSGMAVAKLGLAVNRRFKDQKSGELREEVTFVDIDVFGKQAETASQYLTKGRPVLVEGRLRLDQWDDKQSGQKRSKLKVVGNRLQFLGPPPAGGPKPAPAPGRPAGAKPEGAQAPAAGAEPEVDLDIPQEDIPF
jgi:single-strand DNA-binding protein